jgi:hypothetical protein
VRLLAAQGLEGRTVLDMVLAIAVITNASVTLVGDRFIVFLGIIKSCFVNSRVRTVYFFYKNKILFNILGRVIGGSVCQYV